MGAPPARPPSWVPPLPPRPREAHKASMGKLLIIGGSQGLSGAVVLASEAALRSGVGLVTCAVPQLIGSILEVKTTEAMTAPLPDSGKGILQPAAIAHLQPHLAAAGALVIGPGMGREAATCGFFRTLLPTLRLPSVLDADGLWHLAREPALLRRGDPKRVLTPHSGEMEGLRASLGMEPGERREVAQRFVDKVAGVLVLKGPGTLICEGERAVENPTGNPGMASGGMGDVLAGIIGAFLARGDSPWDAARRAAWLHGRAGDLAAARVGEESLIASDLIAALPDAIRELTGASETDEGEE
ncbi:MAG: NAD(P)H-hydrate dehydratase [Planctomycetota bacterium]